MNDHLNQMLNHLADDKRQNSYSDALLMAKAQIYGEAQERGEYVSEIMIEEKVKELAGEIMRKFGS